MSEPRRSKSRNGSRRPPAAGPTATASRVGDLAAMARILVKLQPCDEPVQRKRKLVAEFCRLLGEQVGRPAQHGHGLAPRMRQTLDRLLAGDSEKQIAGRLRVSQHTVHVYVKGLYRHYAVNSRGELLARFVRGGGGAPEPAPETARQANDTAAIRG